MSGLPEAAHALVTGGGRGIGREIARALKRAGATVTIVGRNIAALEETVAAGCADAAVAADVSDQLALSGAIATAAGRRPIDILIANAGTVESAPFAKSDAALFRRMIDVNVMGVVHAVHAVLPAMRDRPYGRIVAIASTAGLKGYPYVSAYAAAKHAVVGLTRSLALELAATPVTVKAVCPGFADTDLVAHSIETIIKKTGRSREQAVSELAKHNPQGRLITPQQVADTVLWLCGTGAGAITGQAIAVAGGEV